MRLSINFKAPSMSPPSACDLPLVSFQEMQGPEILRPEPTADGGYATADVIGGLFQTTGIGSWACTGHNTCVLTFFTLNYDPTSGALLRTLGVCRA